MCPARERPPNGLTVVTLCRTRLIFFIVVRLPLTHGKEGTRAAETPDRWGRRLPSVFAVRLTRAQDNAWPIVVPCRGRRTAIVGPLPCVSGPTHSNGWPIAVRFVTRHTAMVGSLSCVRSEAHDNGCIPFVTLRWLVMAPSKPLSCVVPSADGKAAGPAPPFPCTRRPALRTPSLYRAPRTTHSKGLRRTP